MKLTENDLEVRDLKRHHSAIYVQQMIAHVLSQQEEAKRRVIQNNAALDAYAGKSKDNFHNTPMYIRHAQLKIMQHWLSNGGRYGADRSEITEHDLDFSKVSNLKYCAGFTLPQLKKKLLDQADEYLSVAYEKLCKEYEGDYMRDEDEIRAVAVELMQSTIFDWNFELIATPEEKT